MGSRAQTDDTYGQITDEKIAELRDRIGEELEAPKPPFTQQVTRDAIRHWAHGIGTDNPLYTDEEYATSSVHGDLIAPPTILLSAMSHYTAGLPGVHGMWAGTDWEWHRPVERGDDIEIKMWLSDVEEKDTSFGGRSVVNTYTTEFYNQDDELFATVDEWNFRVERKSHGSDERQTYTEEDRLAQWSEEEVEEFMEHYQNEEPRGSEPRYFEDVSVDDELDTLLKGPLTVTSMMIFNMGFGGVFLQTDRLMFQTFAKNRNLMSINEMGAPEPPECVHWNEHFADAVGVPTAYDYGNQRVAWMGQVAHHWMGDTGALRDLYVELRSHNFLGDVTWFSGAVTDKRVEDGENLVDIDLVGENHLDEVTTKGSAVVRLPSRDDDLDEYMDSVHSVQ